MATHAALYGAHISLRLEVQVDMNPQFLAGSNEDAEKRAAEYGDEFIQAVEELAARFPTCSVRVTQLPDA